MSNKDFKMITGLSFLDKQFEKGIPIGELSVIVGKPQYRMPLVQFIPSEIPKGTHILVNLEQSEAELKESVCIISDFLEKAEKKGIDVLQYKSKKK